MTGREIILGLPGEDKGRISWNHKCLQLAKYGQYCLIHLSQTLSLV